MNMKRVLLVSILLVIIISSVSAVSAGFFDFLGGSNEIENQTYEFDGCTLSIPADAVVINHTENSYGSETITYAISSESAGENLMFEIMSGAGITNIDDFQIIASSLGATLKGNYNDWAILEIGNMGNPDENVTYYQYGLAICKDSKIFCIEGDNLDTLKSIADTFELKE